MLSFSLAVSLAIFGAAGTAAAAPDCNRQCLDDLMHKYVGALVKHDPKGLPFAEKVQFTENSENAIEFLEVG